MRSGKLKASAAAVLLVGVIGCSKGSGTSDPTGGTPSSTTAAATTPGQSTGSGAAGAKASTPGSNVGTAPGTRGDVSTPARATAAAAGSGAAVSGAAGSGGPGGPGAPSTAAAGSGGTVTGSTPAGDATVDWTMMGYDPGSTYFNKAETTLTKDNAAALQVLWTKNMGGNVLGGALQVGDKMYASGPGAVYALDAATGNELWKTTASSSSTLGYADNTLYLHSTSGNVIAFDAADGKMVWSMKPDPSGTDGSSSAIPVGGVVLIGGSNGGAELGGGAYRGFMSAMDAKTGANKWTRFTVPEGSLGASFLSTASASVEDGLVFGGTGNNYGQPATDTSDSLIAFDFNTGEIKWKFQRVMNDVFPSDLSAPDSDFGNNPVLYEAAIGGAPTKMVAGGTKYGYIVALERTSGEMVWKRDICKMGSADGDSGLFTNFSYSGKGLVGACNEAGPATLVSLDPATGDVQWMRPLKGRVFGRMAFANGVGFVGNGEQLEAYDVDTGMTIKEWPSPAGTIASTITISRGRVTFGDGIAWLPPGLKAGSTLTVLGLK